MARSVYYFASFALLGALSAIWGVNESATAVSPPRHSRPSPSMRKNLPNFDEATPTLYHGGQPTREGFRIVAMRGVKIVIDLRGSRVKEQQLVRSLGMEYVAMPWQCPFPKDKIFAQFLMLVRRNPGKKVFVHCRVGDDRTTMMIAS